jgi:hypothetical protein
MRLRLLAALAATSLLLSAGAGVLISSVGAAPAAAARPATPAVTAQVPCTAAGVASTCTLQLTNLQDVNGTLQAAGTVTGGGTTALFSGVPVALDPAGSCSILSLTLGPLHLDLLGLVVDLNQVVLNITAQPGPGNLLGNLLCAVANLLNNGGPLSGLTNLLNQINTLLAGL